MGWVHGVDRDRVLGRGMDRLLDTRRPRLLLMLFCVLLWLPGFFTLPPGDRDESRFVQASKQMIETGDWVRIRNGAEERNRKPIGIHWMQASVAAAAQAVGVSAAAVWPYRIPSAIGGLVAVLATFSIGQAMFNRRAGLLAGAMLAAAVVLVVEVHIAKTDAALTGATAVVTAVLARAYLQPASVNAGLAVLFWVALGVGVLLKGPIAPMMAGLAVLSLVAVDRRAAWLRVLRPVWGVPLLLALVLPWFVAIGVATQGRFLADAVGGDLGRKLTSGDDQHWGPPGLHLALLPLLLFPASAALPGALGAAWRDRGSAPTRFLLAWIVPSWLVFELAPTKLPHYTLPLYPALCVLVAAWLLAPGPLPRWLDRVSRALPVLAAVVLGVGAAVASALLGVAPAIPALVAAAVVGGFAVRALTVQRMAMALVAAPLVYWAVLEAALPRWTPVWIAPRVVALLPPGTRLGSVGFSEPSLMVLAGTGTRWLLPEEGARALQKGEVDRLVVSDRELPAFTTAAAALGLRPPVLAEVEGYNVSRGRAVRLTLFGPGDQDGIR